MGRGSPTNWSGHNPRPLRGGVSVITPHGLALAIPVGFHRRAGSAAMVTPASQAPPNTGRVPFVEVFENGGGQDETPGTC